MMITFITPHQESTSGGVYAIHQLAFHLSSTFKINLVTQTGEPKYIPGLTTYKSKLLLPDEIPDAKAIILHADAKTGEQFANLPASKGRRFIYFQGYCTPGNSRVIENLKHGFPVIASSMWLVDEAHRYGCDATYVPYGLDYSIFFADYSSKRKSNMITMMTHFKDWKGTSDGLEALSLVMESRQDIEICLFGVKPPPSDFAANFILAPSRKIVASLFRESTVFVCPSWEEGFGMPGLEAMACGASLATTDTKGSRDYAFDGETALVSPPRKPEALARSILKFLEDNKLRKKLADAGIYYVKNHYKPWPDAAKDFEMALSK